MKHATTCNAATLMAAFASLADAAVTAQEAQMLATTHTPWAAKRLHDQLR